MQATKKLKNIQQREGFEAIINQQQKQNELHIAAPKPSWQIKWGGGAKTIIKRQYDKEQMEQRPLSARVLTERIKVMKMLVIQKYSLISFTGCKMLKLHVVIILRAYGIAK
jgi:hypothetical protein